MNKNFKPKNGDKEISRFLGTGYLLINLFFLPGLGTLIGGKTKIGIIQMIMFSFGIFISTTYTGLGFLSLLIFFNYNFGVSISSLRLVISSLIISFFLMAITSWIWGLVSGIKIFKNNYNSRIKMKLKFSVRSYLKIIIISILLFLIGIYFYVSNKNQDVVKLSIPDIWHNLIEKKPFIPGMRQTSSEITSNELSVILDQKFERLKCLEGDTIDMVYRNPYRTRVCDFEIFSHYVEAKVALGMKSELLENEKLMSILNRTYDHYKPVYSNKDKLNPFDNKWNHIMNAVMALDLLSEEEIEFWAIKYVSFELDENYPKVPQIWNRIWMLNSLGFQNIYDLAEKYNLNISYVNESVCNYILPIDTYKKEDIFHEGDKVMFFKYMSFKKFCIIPLTEEDENEMIKIFF